MLQNSFDVVKQLGLHDQDLNPCEVISFLAFNDFVTRPCGITDLSFSLEEEEESNRNATLYLLIVMCKSVFRGILGSFFLWTLVAVVSLVHLKVTCHCDVRNLIFLDANLRTRRRICDDIFRNLISTMKMLE